MGERVGIDVGIVGERVFPEGLNEGARVGAIVGGLEFVQTGSKKKQVNEVSAVSVSCPDQNGGGVGPEPLLVSRTVGISSIVTKYLLPLQDQC